MLGLASCSLVGEGGPGKGSGRQVADRGGAAGAQRPGGQRPPSVVVDVARTMALADRIEAVGTAVANEQADLNSTVTERIARVNFADGAHVPKGAVIAELVRTEQGAQLRQFEARLKEAEAQLERVQGLIRQGFATRAQLDAAQAAVDVAQGQVAAARSQIGDRVIRAPFAGWLSLRRISPGTVVSAGTPIATIVDYSRIKLDFPVPETYLSAIREGAPITARAAAFPGETFEGRVATIDPIIDPVTRAATVRAILPNRDLRLRPGMLMTVEVESRPRTAVVVPELAVVGLGEQHYVFTLDAQNRARRRDVTTGRRQDGLVEIVSGLGAGERLVVEGTVKVRDGLVVAPVPRGQAQGAA
ncbi:efflux RND transporter periplasmic adaptor subunit [Thermaurantiacus sp.]